MTPGGMKATVKGRRRRGGAGGECKPIWSGAREDECSSGLEGLQGRSQTGGGHGSGRTRRRNSVFQMTEGSRDSISIYAIQCNECEKWRTIQTKQEFEMIRESYDEDPWVCSRAPGGSGKDPEDIQYDSSRIWVMDKAGIPMPPPETERLLIMRGDLSKMDTYYVMPNGKRARCGFDVERFIEENPEYKGRLPLSRFSFVRPKISRETAEETSHWRAAISAKAEKEMFGDIDDVASDPDYYPGSG